MNDTIATVPSETATVASVGSEVWVLSIETSHGLNLTAHVSEQSAFAGAHAFVRQWWDNEMGDEKIPADPFTAVSTYFEEVEEEYYSIQQVTVEA